MTDSPMTMSVARSAQHGRPLAEAVYKFAPPTLKRELKRVRSEPLECTRPTEPLDRAEAVKHIFGTMNLLLKRWGSVSAPKLAMQESMIEGLATGRLEASGVKTKPEPGPPQKIPAYIFDGRPRVDVAKSTVENFGWKFEAVKVSRPANSAPTLAVQTDANPPPIPNRADASKGRPTKASEIDYAIDIAVRQGIDIGNIERRIAYGKIRQIAQDILHKNVKRGYSDPVIQRVLVRRFGKLA